jgi:hypothetical protein
MIFSPCVDINSYSPFQPSAAVSAEADMLHAFTKREFREFYNPPVSLTEVLSETIKSMIDVYDETSLPNWDGYDAKEVTFPSLYEAWKFIQLMPSTIPAPEVVPEPSGAIAFEWKKGPNHFVVSFQGVAEIMYAGIFGVNRHHGVESFKDSLPRSIMENLQAFI